MADSFVQSFLNIEGPFQRLKAIQHLVDSLSFNERQITCTSISRRNDIVTRLPIELILQVFAYLDLRDTWTLQRVNPRWREMLSSEEFLRTSLDRWDTHDVTLDSCRSLEEIPKMPIPDRIRHMRAVDECKPFTQAIMEDTGTGLQGPHPQLPHRRLDLSRDKIAYICSRTGEEDTVVVHNLITGAASTLRGEARERIMSVMITTTHVAFVTFEGCLYVAEHSDPLCSLTASRIQLPSARVRAMSAHGQTIALAMGAGSLHCGYVTSVLLYDIETQRLQDLSVDATQEALEGDLRKLGSCGLIVDSKRRTVDVFTLLYDTGYAGGPPPVPHSVATVSCFRLSFSGQVHHPQTRSHMVGRENACRDTHFTMAPPQRTGSKDEYLIHIGQIRTMGGLPVASRATFTFDAETAVLAESVAQTKCCRLSTLDCPIIGFERIHTAMPVLWKGLYVTLSLETQSHWYEYIALMNDSFLVSLEVNIASTQKSRIRVFCFEEKMGMFGANDFGFWD